MPIPAPISNKSLWLPYIRAKYERIKVDLLFEFEDKKWFPAGLRSMQMEFIGWMVVFLKIYRPLLPVLQNIVKPHDAIQDLCSGSAYPARNIFSQLGDSSNKLILSDLYPQSLLSLDRSQSIEVIPNPFDVLYMEVNSDRIYTMFNAFHHFNAVQQEHILTKLSNTRFVVAEVLSPGIFELIKIFLTTTILQVIAAPFVTPFSLKRIFFTWILPINLITVSWDGLVSVIKSLPAKRYHVLVNSMKNNGVVINYAVLGPFWARVHVLYKQT